MLAKLIFWISGALVLYVYAGYPLLLSLIQVLFRRSARREGFEPSVSLIISAYNEADVIAAKIHNSLSLDYPADRLEIVIASDGSKDNTAQIARAAVQNARNSSLRLVEFAENRGKL